MPLCSLAAHHCDRNPLDIFNLPGSKFFRDVLSYFNLHPQHLIPNSISNIYHNQILCEAYMQLDPTISLFKEFFYINRQTKFANGPSLELTRRGFNPEAKRRFLSSSHSTKSS